MSKKIIHLHFTQKRFFKKEKFTEIKTQIRTKKHVQTIAEKWFDIHV
jgi:hypothetical protein